MNEITVEFAVYGALKNGDENDCRAADVKTLLQKLIDSQEGIVTIDNSTMGGDPCPGNGKHFGAQITRSDGTYYYACQEGQKIDFCHGGWPEASYKPKED